jgi:hypothetical protein
MKRGRGIKGLDDKSKGMGILSRGIKGLDDKSKGMGILMTILSPKSAPFQFFCWLLLIDKARTKDKAYT